MHKSFISLLTTSALCVSLVGCTNIPSSLPHQTTLDVGERKVEYVLDGHGSPTIIFENGLDGTLGWWSKVLPQVAPDATVLAYNRPGYGRSTRTNSPRDGEHVVQELREFLQARGLKAPYLLVGHSLGGLYMQLYTRMHPDEVSGLLLVDSTHPQQLQGTGAMETWPAWLRSRYTSFLTTPVAVDELAQLGSTGEQVLSRPVPSGMPMTILVALQPVKNNSARAIDANAKRLDFQRLYPQATFIQVNSGHGIPQEHPELVINAIRDLLRPAGNEPSTIP